MAMYGFLVKLNGKDTAVSTGIIPEGDKSQHKGVSKVGQPGRQKRWQLRWIEDTHTAC